MLLAVRNMAGSVEVFAANLVAFCASRPAELNTLLAAAAVSVASLTCSASTIRLACPGPRRTAGISRPAALATLAACATSTPVSAALSPCAALYEAAPARAYCTPRTVAPPQPAPGINIEPAVTAIAVLGFSSSHCCSLLPTAETALAIGFPDIVSVMSCTEIDVSPFSTLCLAVLILSWPFKTPPGIWELIKVSLSS